MNKDNHNIIMQPWKNYEDHLVNVIEKKSVSRKNAEELIAFLKYIGFLEEENKLSNRGREYYYKKFIENNETDALNALTVL